MALIVNMMRAEGATAVDPEEFMPHFQPEPESPIERQQAELKRKVLELATKR